MTREEWISLLKMVSDIEYQADRVYSLNQIRANNILAITGRIKQLIKNEIGDTN